MSIENLIIEMIKLVIIVGGVVWGIYRFRLEAPHKPRVEFDVSAKFIGPVEGYYAAELVVTATNKGLRTRTFEQIYLTVRGINRGTRLEEWEQNKPRLLFPIKLMDKVELVYKKKYKSVFVEPGVTQHLTYFVRIPEEISIISMRAEFKYTEKKSHSAERMIHVTSTGSDKHVIGTINGSERQ